MSEHPSVADNVRFTVPGRIGGKQRAGRLIQFRHDGKPIVRSFNPPKSVKWEKTVADCATFQVMRRRPLMKGPIGLEVRVWQQPPVSWSKKKRERAVWITGKPDCDNVLKLIGDALNKVAWGDDSQIAHVVFSRCYSLTNNEHIDINIFPLEAS